MKNFTLMTAALLAGTPAVMADSPKIQCWGSNSQGQTNVPADLQIRALPDNPVQVAVSDGVTCVLGKGGTVTCRGKSPDFIAKIEALTQVSSVSLSPMGACAIAAGKMQCFSWNHSPGFETPPELSAPISVAVGGYYACAQDAKGVSCWGDDYLGSGIANVPALSNPRRLVVSYETACALDDHGVQCWGGDDFGLLNVPSLKKPREIVAGLSYACALDDGGTHCWGSDFLQIPVPTVPSLKPGTTFSGGENHLCGLDSTGVHCWGDAHLGQLAVPALSHPKAIFGGSSANQTCALDDSGIHCWGADDANQSSLGAIQALSTGNANTCAVIGGAIRCWGGDATGVNTPLALSDGYSVAVGGNYACALNSMDSQAHSCWGANAQLTQISPPLPNPQGYSADSWYYFGVPSIYAGMLHACTSVVGGTFPSLVSCWGNNDFGQATPPVRILLAAFPGALSAGGYHTCAINQMQTVQCWGRNEFGQTLPSTLTHPTQVSAGFAHTCAIGDQGVVCWGRDKEGQTDVPKLKNPRLVRAGGYHTCALDDDGVKCWGENEMGQSQVPGALPGKIALLSAGMFHTCVGSQ